MRPLPLVLLLVLAPALWAQDAMPKRPKLPRDADTNDAQAYFEFGLRQGRNPWRAHDAFHWASRLEPSQPVYLYARYHALISRQPADWQRNYVEGAEFIMKSKDGRLVDSVLGDVMVRDPFAYPQRLEPRASEARAPMALLREANDR
jgi:hypothetical protein